MANRFYTAQEMRDVAQCLYYNSPTKLTVEAAVMLRQAADMRERCDNYLFVVTQIKDERIRDDLVKMMNSIIYGNTSGENDEN